MDAEKIHCTVCLFLKGFLIKLIVLPFPDMEKSE